MKHWTTLYIVTSLILLFGIFTQRALGMPATPNPSLQPFPALILSRVDSKNAESDNITITVKDDLNNGNGASVKGLTLYDDASFFTLEEDIYMRTNETITFIFNAMDQDIEATKNGITVHLGKKGLTGTTEQIVILGPDNTVIDALCWTSDSPTTAEEEDMQELFERGGWYSADPAHCFPSKDIKKDSYLERISIHQDTDTKEDWTLITPQETIDEENLQQTTKPEPEPGKDNNPEVESLPICPSLSINEIMPNPSGRDSGNEWIELKNISTSDCAAKGWVVDDEEGGSKPYTIAATTLIPSQKYLLLPSWETKINLNNTNDTVRLFSPDDDMIESIHYEDAPDNQSFARLPESDSFEWTVKLTPYTENLFENEEEKKEEKKKKTTEKNIPDGDLSQSVHITELLPNPKGSDSGNEWIELFNNDDQVINLANWTLGNQNKTYTFPETKIKPKNYLILSDKDIGFSLKNSTDTITLNDFEETTIDSVSYNDVKENHSYMNIIIHYKGQKETSWSWEEKPTPGAPNQDLYRYEGAIVEYQKENGVLTIEIDENQKTELISINTLLTGEMITNTIFETGTIIQVTLRKDNNQWLLEDYQILLAASKEEQSNNTDGLLYIALSSVAPLGYIGYKAFVKYKLIKIV